jgi:tetratricopeptide (TPR) repeat protein
MLDGLGSQMIDDNINHARQTLILCPPDAPERPARYDTLMDLLFNSFGVTQNMALLDECISLQEDALEECPVDRPRHTLLRMCLAESLRIQAEMTGHIPSLQRSMTILQQILALANPSGYPDQSLIGIELALSLKVLFKWKESDSLLEEIIHLERQALASWHPGHPRRANACGNLAVSLSILFERTGHDSVLEEAIRLGRETRLLLSSNYSLNPAASSSNLVLLLRARFERRGDLSLLEEAIGLTREALLLDPFNFETNSNLATMLWEQFHLTRDNAVLDESIRLQGQLVAQHTNHPNRDMACMNLGRCLHELFEQTGYERLLNESLDLQREALALQPTGHRNHPMACSNLAMSLLLRFSRGIGDDSSVGEARVLFEEALDLLPPHHSGRWRTLLYLAQFYNDPQYSHQNLVKAFEYIRMAITPDVDNLPDLLREVAFVLNLFQE